MEVATGSHNEHRNKVSLEIVGSGSSHTDTDVETTMDDNTMGIESMVVTTEDDVLSPSFVAPSPSSSPKSHGSRRRGGGDPHAAAAYADGLLPPSFSDSEESTPTNPTTTRTITSSPKGSPIVSPPKGADLPAVTTTTTTTTTEVFDPKFDSLEAMESLTSPSPSPTGPGAPSSAKPKPLQHTIDKYGFITNSTQNMSSVAMAHSARANAANQNGSPTSAAATAPLGSRSTSFILRREKKWRLMMERGGELPIKKNKKVKKRARKGVPDSMRGVAWAKLGNVPYRMNVKHAGLYKELVRETSGSGFDDDGTINSVASTRETIERDIHRTFPSHHLFYSSGDLSSSEEDDFIGSDMESSMVDTDLDPTDIVVDDEMMEYEPSSWTTSFNNDGGTSPSPAAAAAAAAAAAGGANGLTSRTTAATFLDSITCNGSLDNVDDDCKIDSIKETNSILLDESPASASATTTTTKMMAPKESPPSQASPKFMRAKKIQKEKDTIVTQKGGQASLRRVLRAYSAYDAEVGYCQGMNFIAAMFITFMSEEESFWLLVSVMNDPPCHMRALFGEGMAGAHRVLYVADKLIGKFLPKLANHFKRENIDITMFATQWLLTLYTSSFPWELVTRVWDAFLAEGWKMVYRVMLALLEEASPKLLKLSFEDILAFLRDLPLTVQAKPTLDAAFRIPLKRKIIHKFELEWLAKQKDKKW